MFVDICYFVFVIVVAVVVVVEVVQVVYVSVFDLLVWDYWFFLLGALISLGWSFLYSTFCTAGFVNGCVNFGYIVESIVFPSTVFDSFAECRSLGWHMYSSGACSPPQVLQLVESPLSTQLSWYGIWVFPLQLLTFFLCSLHWLFWLLCAEGKFFSDPDYLMFWMFLVPW